MPTPPTATPDWANSADPTDIATPPSATIASGWPAGVRPPHEWVNYWWNLVGLWITYLSATQRIFATVDAAVVFADANMATGDMLTVWHDDNDKGPGGSTGSVATGAITANEGSVDCSGRLVVAAFGTNHPAGVDRDWAAIATYTRTNAGTNHVIKTDGVTTVVAYGQYVEAFNATTGASLWVHDNSIPVADFCMAAGFLYIVHPLTTGAGDDTANRHVHKLNLTTGAVIWSFRHSVAVGELRSCCTNGRQLFIAGLISDYASGANFRAIVCSNGYDATNEGGNGDDDSGLAWDKVLTTAPTWEAAMDCDGVMVYLGLPTASANQLEAYGQHTGELAWSFAHPSGVQEARSVAVDQDYVYVCYGTTAGPPEVGEMNAHDKRTGAPAWSYGLPLTASTRAAGIAVVSNGAEVFYLGDDGDRFLRRLSRGNVPTRFRVIDRTTELIRYRNWKLQPEAQ